MITKAHTVQLTKMVKRSCSKTLLGMFENLLVYSAFLNRFLYDYESPNKNFRKKIIESTVQNGFGK